MIHGDHSDYSKESVLFFFFCNSYSLMSFVFVFVSDFLGVTFIFYFLLILIGR